MNELNNSKRKQLRNLYYRDRGICATCQLFVEWKDASRGHILAKANGGKGTYENLVLEHKKCNTSHGDVTVGVDELEYSMHLWEELCSGVKMETSRLIRAFKFLTNNAELETRRVAFRALMVLKNSRVGDICMIHKIDSCQGIISYSKAKYGTQIYKYPCTLCGEEL